MAASPQGVAEDASCLLPTAFGEFTTLVFREGAQGKEAVVLCFGDQRGRAAVHTRVHDQCMTCEGFHSLTCDCRHQLEHSLKHIGEHTGGGILIYLQQEGRGIGLINKIRAYQVQQSGHDTVDANRVLGLPDDCREYACVPRILESLGVSSISLMTNNPRKLEALEALGVHVDARLPLMMDARLLSPQAGEHVQTRIRRLEHIPDPGTEYTTPCTTNTTGTPDVHTPKSQL